MDATHLVSAFATDDSYDIDQGYQGRGQFWLAVQNAHYADHAGEHDGDFGARVADYLSTNNELTGGAPARTLDRSSRGFLRALDPRPTDEALSASTMYAPRDDFFEAVDYVGVFGPDENWAQSWTYVGNGGSEYPGPGLIRSGESTASSRVDRE